jgi:hypothetical protein
MREYLVSVLILSFAPCLSAQVVPAGWKLIKDSKDACQMAVPPDWSPFGDNAGVAVFHDSSTAIVLVTSQPDQPFKSLPEAVQRVMGVPKERMFENTDKRIYYQFKVSANGEDPNAYSVAVPGKTGTCSAHLTLLPVIQQETARKIALSLGPAETPPSN